MGLPWVRLDTSIFDNPKFLVLVGQNRYRAVVAYVAGMAYSGKHMTGGFIQREVLPIIHARPQEMAHLMEVGLLDPAQGGWQIHDWDEYQLTTQEVQDRRAKAQKAAAQRWENERQRRNQITNLTERRKPS